MSREMIEGVWIIKCDFEDEDGNPCNLGVNGEPAMFIDPTGGKDPDEHFQCGNHHGIVKQEDNPDFQLPEGHKLEETRLESDGYVPTKKVELDGFKPDAAGRVWEGANDKK